MRTRTTTRLLLTTRRLLLVYICIWVTWCACFAQAACRFPSSWHGTWFQSGVQQTIQITGDDLSFKGRCVQVEGDKFLLEDKKEGCYRCVVMHEKHVNALQYKETFCDSRDTLENLCSRINGDAQLYSMFRVKAVPVGCPFHGTFTFTYNRGHGECRYPVSSIDSCTEESRLLLRYQACPDVHGSESTVEELVCLAMWKEGSTRYLVGELDHSRASSNEDKFRCFIYEDLEDDSGYQVAQSGDATCIGLFSPIEGSRTMKLSRASSPPALCEFPSWLTQTSVWQTLDGRTAYIFDSSTNTTLNVTEVVRGTTQLHAVCTVREHTTERVASVVVHATVGCDNGYMCLKFYKRREHVIEVQKGTITRNSEKDACKAPHFDKAAANYETLLTTSLEPGQCPYLGTYGSVTLERNVFKDNRDSCKGYTGITSGCDGRDLIEVQPSCPSQQRALAYQCHGHWEENGTNYLITTQRGSKAKYCFIYVEVDNTLRFSSFLDHCNRRIQPGVHGNMTFNITNRGDCKDPVIRSSAFGLRPSHLVILIVLCLWQVR